MGGACSRKRDQQVNEDSPNRGVSGRYTKSGSSKWLGTSFSRACMDASQGKQSCPSLMDLCIYKIREVCFTMIDSLILYLGKSVSSYMCFDKRFLLIEGHKQL